MPSKAWFTLMQAVPPTFTRTSHTQAQIQMNGLLCCVKLPKKSFPTAPSPANILRGRDARGCQNEWQPCASRKSSVSSIDAISATGTH